MSVISNKARAIDQLFHKDNIADIISGSRPEKKAESEVVTPQIEIVDGRREQSSRNTSKADDKTKILAGALAMVGDTALAAELTGVSKETARKAAKGIVTRTRGFEEPFATAVLDKKDSLSAPIKERAIDVIKLALESISPDEMNNAKLRDKAAVAKDMAIIVDKFNTDGRGNAISFHFHAPRERKETEYVTKEV